MNIENRQIDNSQFLAMFLVTSGMVGIRKTEEGKLLPKPKRERFSFIPEDGEGDDKKIIKGKFEPYFNVNKHSNEIIARVYQEERKDALKAEERITHAEDYFESMIETDNWGKHKHANSEKEETKNVFEMQKEGFNMMIWISPVSDIYEEGRLNIQLPGVKNREKFFELWGIPIPHNWKESIELGNKLLDEGGKLNGEARMLREQPIGFKLQTGENWIKKCEKLMPEMDWAWEAIKSGKVDENMKKLALKVKEAKIIARGDNVLFEKIMLNMGYKLNVSGNHGGSWLSRELGNGIGVVAVKGADGEISYRIGSTEGLTLCKKCGCWYSGDKCPVCG